MIPCASMPPKTALQRQFAWRYQVWGVGREHAAQWWCVRCQERILWLIPPSVDRIPALTPIWGACSHAVSHYRVDTNFTFIPPEGWGYIFGDRWCPAVGDRKLLEEVGYDATKYFTP